MSTEVNASVPAVEPVVVNSGESAVTFDDLERVEEQSKNAKRAEKDQTKEVIKETVKELDKAKGGTREQDKKAKEAGENEGETEEDEGKEKAPKKRDGTKEDEGKLAKPKLKARVGDKEVELDPEIIVPVKINGKDELISLKDLQGNYSGKVAYDRKFQEMDRDRKAFEGKLKIATDRITSIFEEPDPEIRLFKMAEFAGKDPVEVRNKFIAENLELLEKYYSMSEDERNADALAYENRILKHKQESHTKAETARKTQEELAVKVQQLEETHGLDSQEYWTQFDRIVELSKAGRITEKVTPEFVAEVAVKEKMWSKLTEHFGNKVDAPLMVKAIEEGYKAGFSAEEIISYLGEHLKSSSDEADKKIESKIEEIEESRTGKKPATKKAVSSDVWSFDQM